MRRMIGVVMVAMVVLGAAACGGGSSTANYCKVYDETHPQMTAALGNPGSKTYDQLTAGLDQFDELLRQRRDAAPSGTVRDAYDALIAGKPDASQPLSVTSAYDQAPATINAWTEEHCKLPGDL